MSAGRRDLLAGRTPDVDRHVHSSRLIPRAAAPRTRDAPHQPLLLLNGVDPESGLAFEPQTMLPNSIGALANAAHCVARRCAERVRAVRRTPMMSPCVGRCVDPTSSRERSGLPRLAKARTVTTGPLKGAPVTLHSDRDAD
jgi:hypothetical protein